MEHLSKAAASLSGAGLVFPQISSADVDVEAFEKDGMVSMPMGVSGQAGKVCGPSILLAPFQSVLTVIYLISSGQANNRGSLARWVGGFERQQKRKCRR